MIELRIKNDFGLDRCWSRGSGSYLTTKEYQSGRDVEKLIVAIQELSEYAIRDLRKLSTQKGEE